MIGLILHVKKPMIKTKVKQVKYIKPQSKKKRIYLYRNKLPVIEGLLLAEDAKEY